MVLSVLFSCLVCLFVGIYCLLFACLMFECTFMILWLSCYYLLVLIVFIS